MARPSYHRESAITNQAWAGSNGIQGTKLVSGGKRVLRGTKTPRYLVNDDAIALAADMGVSGVVLGWFQESLPHDRELDEAGFTQRFEKAMSFVTGQAKRKLFEVAALAAYRAQTEVPVVTTLLGDDARQFDEITDERALCWIHDGRHYAKLRDRSGHLYSSRRLISPLRYPRVEKVIS